MGTSHAEDVRLAAILKFLSSQQLDQLFCVGDITDGIGSVDRCCELLSAYKVSTVLGNHDQWCLENSNRGVGNATILASLCDETRRFLESLARTYVVKTAGGNAMICHGLGEYNMASVRPTDSSKDIFNNLELWALYRDDTLRFVINGHSHRSGINRFDHLVVVNSGSLDIPKSACVVIVDFEDRAVEFYLVNDSSHVEHLGTSRL